MKIIGKQSSSIKGPMSLLMAAVFALQQAIAATSKCTDDDESLSGKCPFRKCLEDSECASGKCMGSDETVNVYGSCTMLPWQVALIIFGVCILICAGTAFGVIYYRRRKFRNELHVYSHVTEDSGIYQKPQV